MSRAQDRPIFIVGMPRSGTTLLQVLLNSHPRIAGLPEVHFFHRIYDLRDYFGDLADDANLRRVVHDLVNPAAPMFDGCGFDEDRIFERIAAGDRSYRSVLEEFMTDFAERQGKPRWSEKTPGQSPTEIWGLFPDAQVLHIIRDPRDSIASAASAAWMVEPAAVIARRWTAFTAGAVAAGSARGPGDYLSVRYEDLTADPERVMQDVCAALGEDYHPQIIEPAGRSVSVPEIGLAWLAEAQLQIRPARRSEARSAMSRLQRLRVLGIVGADLPVHGYTVHLPAGYRLGRWLERLSQAGGAIRRTASHGQPAPPITPQRRYELTQQHMALVRQLVMDADDPSAALGAGRSR